MTGAVVVTAEEAEAWRKTVRGIVTFTNGVFDLMHMGHVHLLHQARQLGDTLIVGVNSDRSAAQLGKGPGRPICSADERAQVVAANRHVDKVVLFDEPTPADLIERLAPDILVKGMDYAGQVLPGQSSVEARGGRVVLIPLWPNSSSTRIVEKIREQN